VRRTEPSKSGGPKTGGPAKSASRRRAGRRRRHPTDQTAPEAHRHLLIDVWDCPAEILRDEALVRGAMLEAAERGGATVVDSTFHVFGGGGITGIVAVQESHLTIHTWPERGYAAIDVFLCGERADAQAAADHLVTRLGGGRVVTREEARGHDAADESDPTPVTPAPPRRTATLYLLTVVVAMCSIVYELLLAQTLSAILGNTVLRYSITIGCYLGALGVGAILVGSRHRDAAGRLLRVEVALSALGGLAVPLFYAFDAVQRYVYLSAPYGSVWDTIAPAAFLIATHLVIVAIGLLSGFEVPLLITLGEQLRPRSTNRILGIDYFGALLGSVLFPLVLLRTLGLVATGFAVALLNAVAAAVLFGVWRPARGRVPVAFAGVAVAAVLVLGLLGAERIEQYFLKKFYFAEQVTSLGSLLAPMPEVPDVERYRSPYQTIDIVRSDSPDQWLFDAIIDGRSGDGDGKARNLWLYLDREYQVYAGSDELYHEWFVHAPIQAAGRVPRQVAVIGGGDGLAIRELLKYPHVERIVHVDIDPEMIRLAAEHPVLSAMNGNADDDPRVELVLGDAFQWLRTTGDRFDAVYVDVPRPRAYGLAMLFSREFYGMIRARLDPDGFLAIDTPGGSCDGQEGLWSVYYSTLKAAGYATVTPLVTRFDATMPRITNAAATLANQLDLRTQLPGGGTMPMTTAQKRGYVTGRMLEILGGIPQEFTVAFPRPRDLEVEWRDFGVDLAVFGPNGLRLAFPDDCPTEVVSSEVNSVFRPTLPRIWWLWVPTA